MRQHALLATLFFSPLLVRPCVMEDVKRTGCRLDEWIKDRMVHGHTAMGTCNDPIVPGDRLSGLIWRGNYHGRPHNNANMCPGKVTATPLLSAIVLRSYIYTVVSCVRMCVSHAARRL